jgi:transcriptional regulator with XRE-family HTH domain
MKYPSVNTNYTQKVREVTLGNPIPKQLLTAEVHLAFSSLTTKEERNQYVWRLRTEEGWSLESIGQAIGVTREMVRLIVKELNKTSFTLLPTVSHLVVPKRVRYEKVTFKRKPLDPSVAVRLKELHARATLVRGKSSDNRFEAGELSRLIHEQTLLGVSTYTIAKELGLTIGAINLRLIRYGYKKTQGKSRALTRIKYPQQKKEATHDNTTNTGN